MASRAYLRALTLGLHFGLLIALGFALWRIGWSLTVFAGIMALAALPLVAALPGLMADRAATLRWLAVALVAYVGLATVEVVADRSPASAALLLLALLELGVVLLLTRMPPRR